MKAWLLALALIGLFGGQARARTLTLDPSTGTLRVLLYKGGPLAAFGHDHVLAAPAFSGQIELSSASASLALTIDARALVIDSSAARKAEGLGPIGPRDLAKIDAGMRGERGLDVARHPEIALRSQSIEPVAGEKQLWLLNGVLSLHGAQNAIDFPVTMIEGPDGALWFSGYVRLRPSEFGVQPFSVFGGAVRLKDEALVRFSLLARPR